ncbi:MAG: hypothetical protein ABI588_10650 [Arenimonas sp.]
MASSKSKSRPASRRATQFQPQDIFFAGIGAVSLGRKQAVRLYAKAGPAARLAAAYARDAQEQAMYAASDAQEKVREFVSRVNVLEFAAKAESAARKQLAPVLARFGIKQKKAAAKAHARKKPAVRRRRAA